MGLISAIKSLLGIGDSHDRSHDGTAGTDVTVERETDASSERAVKESDAEARGTADTGGTDVDGVDGTEEAASSDTSETDDGDGAELSFDNEMEATSEDGVGSAEEGDDSADGEPVDRIKGIGPSYSEQLTDAGVRTVSDLADADAAELNEATGIGENRIQGWIDRANAR